ncbi:hypothetical protein M9H77_23700 [Catharanthus roseus]|uniref:Uncharacterized protein n=1 Tax=Catharanthus roseus TaxID=4058 RepID=A0ACC0ATN1_CATRO|nr:hypothetical protein M9H77_23700 [Catharanthus roseus]
MATSKNWQFFIHNGRHNHNIAIYSHGHAHLQDLRMSSCNRPSSSGRVMFYRAIYYDFSEHKTLVVQLVPRKFTMLLPRLEGLDAGKKYGRGSSPLKYRKGLHRFI